MEGNIETFWDAVELMLFVYALAAVVSLAVAWLIKAIYGGVRLRAARVAARADAAREAD